MKCYLYLCLACQGLHSGIESLRTPCGKLSPDSARNYSASSSCQLGHNFSDPAQDSVLSGRKLFGMMDVNTWATMPQRPHGYKAGTPFSRYRLPPTHRRFLVSHSISVSIHSLICSAISQWLFAHSPCSSLSYLPRNPLRPLMSSRRIIPLPFLEPAQPTALPRR